MNELCNILNSAASYVHHWLKRQPAVKEETLTDWLLFEISERTNRIRYRMFTRHEEARQTGADWEWWFVSKNSHLRIRIQAKKAQGTKDLYPELMRTNAYGLQIEKLIADSKSVNAIPMYAFFTSLSASGLCGGRGPKQEGVFLSSANRIQSSFLANGRAKITPAQILTIANPISCAFCCPLSEHSDSPIEYFQRYFLEEFGSSADLNGSSGIHKDLPRYVMELLNAESNQDPFYSESIEIEVPKGFNSLLVVDLRDSKQQASQLVET
jgi:hypothetical protein